MTIFPEYQNQSLSSINVKLFCDELITQEWIYLGILIVQSNFEENILQNLLNSRCGNKERNWNWDSCPTKCQYHVKNDTEVHYQEVERSKDKFYVAQRWIEYILNDRNSTCFYILSMSLY